MSDTEQNREKDREWARWLFGHINSMVYEYLRGPDGEYVGSGKIEPIFTELAIIAFAHIRASAAEEATNRKGLDGLTQSERYAALLSSYDTLKKDYDEIARIIDKAARKERERCVNMASLQLISSDETGGILGEDDLAFNEGIRSVISALISPDSVSDQLPDTGKVHE